MVHVRISDQNAVAVGKEAVIDKRSLAWKVNEILDEWRKQLRTGDNRKKLPKKKGAK
jgi:hypothetical protein